TNIMTDLIVKTYIAYLPIAILLTFIVARIFFKNSTIFMLDIFSGRQEIASSTNKLFETGFYLLCLGFALFRMKINKQDFISYENEMIGGVNVNTEKLMYGMQELFETLSSKIGILAVVLGIMVFFLMYMLFRGKKKSAEGRARKLNLEKLPQI
ncbi:MAG: putative membrane protein, partial [Bacteroidia bacterium]